MADKDIKKEESELEDDLSPEDETIAPEDNKALSENADQNDNRDSQGIPQNQTQAAQNQAQASTPPTQEQTQAADVNAPAVGDSGLSTFGIHPPVQNAQARDAEDMAQQKDFATRQITPETYSSMFAKKDTLGKIGTIFGLMLSGAGSGLAHQPNLLMEMMNNQIKNDLEAQKTNVTNAQNFLNLNYAHELQQSQIARNAILNKATEADIALNPARKAQLEAAAESSKADTVYKNLLSQGYPKQLAAELALKTAQVKQAESGSQANLAAAESSRALTAKTGIETEKAKTELGPLKAQAAAEISALQNFNPNLQLAQPTSPESAPQQVPTDQIPNSLPHPHDMQQATIAAPLRAENQMRTAVGQHLTDISANNPQALNTLQTTILPAINMENQKNNAKLESLQQSQQASIPAVGEDVINDRNRLNAAISVGRFAPQIPGAITPAQEAKIHDEETALQKNRDEYAAYIDATRQLQALGNNAGQTWWGGIAKSGVTGVGAVLGALTGGLTGAVGGGAVGNVAGEGINNLIKSRERERNAIIAPFLARYGKDAETMFPAWSDTPKSRQEAFDKAVQNFKIMDAQAAPTLHHYGFTTPFKEVPFDTNINTFYDPKYNKMNAKDAKNARLQDLLTAINIQ